MPRRRTATCIGVQPSSRIIEGMTTPHVLLPSLPLLLAVPEPCNLPASFSVSTAQNRLLLFSFSICLPVPKAFKWRFSPCWRAGTKLSGPQRVVHCSSCTWLWASPAEDLSFRMSVFYALPWTPPESLDGSDLRFWCYAF